MSRQLFGTDGVRGRAGEFLSAELAVALSRATVELCEEPHPQVLIVRDTRESGEMLEAAIAAGVTAAGGDVLLGGVLPTPAAPLLVRRHGLQLAAVISASHNPYEDNGIKFFAADGFKLSDQTEAAIEQQMLGQARRPDRIGRVRELHGALEDYLRELHTRFAELDLSGTRVLLDCAHGATFRVAPEIFRRLGAEVDVLADSPDGRNINAGVGSTHIERLSETIAAGEYAIGFAFDGDGDRMLAVDRRGQIVDGDELIALAAVHYKRIGRLDGGGVAVTVMTNYGFHTAMTEAGIDVATTAVGDRYVYEALRDRGWRLGGEQSGHIIDLGFGPSGDGIASALLTLEALAGSDLAERHAMRKLPQRLVNLRAATREALAAAIDASTVKQAIASADAALSGRGRVLVRVSGTEPLIRVMVEAPSEEETEAVVSGLCQVVEEALAG
ncbi:MAG TPA: phosphoglucosamine mutase [Solirubrobacteraceae bacterium]|nr:phosphoglucosamine mutase [Solirubrobacteraceae bacterium]